MSQQFGQFTASELYCPKCKRAQPVREKLLLILPSGALHEFLCTGCGSPLAKRTVTQPPVSSTPPPASRRPHPAPRRLLH